MTTLPVFRPRHESVAKRILFVLTVVAAFITLLFAYVFPTSATRIESSVTAAGCAVMLALVSWLVAVRVPPSWLWAAYPFAAIAVIAALDITSDDAGITAQVFFFFPVLYAGAQLRRHGAGAICAAAVLAELTVTATQLPVGTAAVDTSFVAAALITTAALLVSFGERNDALIAKLEQQAATDTLTGLVTRRVLDRAAQTALTSAGGNGGTALLLIDVDHFKQVNDVHGHPAGDRVLQQLAEILQTANRSSDIISRMGGDEIAVLIPGCPLTQATHRADEILLAVHEHTFDVGAVSMAVDPDATRALRLTVSIGVAHLPTHARDLRALYTAADMSLYEAKRGGRNQVGRNALDALTG